MFARKIYSNTSVRLMPEVLFPDGTKVRATGWPSRDENREWREFGLYMDAKWQPTWPAIVLDWPDFEVPSNPEVAAAEIQAAFRKARSGLRVEVGCLGGTGRTGIVLACMAILAGVEADRAVGWVRKNYSPYAVETPQQEAWVMWFSQNG